MALTSIITRGHMGVGTLSKTETVEGFEKTAPYHWRPSKHDVVLSAVVSLVVGLCFSIGHAFYTTSGNMTFEQASFWLWTVACTTIAMAILLVIFWLWDTWSGKADGSSRLSRWFIGFDAAHRRFIIMVIVLVMWTPAFLAFYPGNYSSDAPQQVTTLLNDGVLDLHWPAAHTLLLTGCFELGRTVLGSYSAGLTLFCALQAMFLAFVLALTVDRLISWKVSPVIATVLTLPIASNPVMQYFAFATTKDSLFAGFLVVSLVYFIDLLRDPKSFVSSAGKMVVFFLAATGMCLMRKQALYVLIVVMLIAFPFVHGWTIRFRVLAPAVGALVLSMLFGELVPLCFTTSADSVREVLSVPSQQIARTYMLCYDDLSNEQIKEISQYYDLSALEAGRATTNPWVGYTGIGAYYDTISGRGYLEPVSDPAKAALNGDAYRSSPAGYWSMWFSLMRGHEDTYLEAFLWGDVGYVYPTSAAANRWSVMVSPWNEFSLTLDGVSCNEQVSNYNETSLLPIFRDWLVDNGWAMFSGNYILMLVTSPALPFLVLILSLALLVRREKRMIIAWLLPFIYWVSLCLGPVMCVRYVVPLFFCIPLLLGMLFMPATTYVGNGIIYQGPSQTKSFKAL